MGKLFSELNYRQYVLCLYSRYKLNLHIIIIIIIIIVFIKCFVSF